MICVHCGNLTPLQQDTISQNHETMSRVDDLIRSLSPLSRSDVMEVPRISAQLDEEIEQYENQILHLESRIMYLRSKQEFLKSRKGRLNSLTAPIRRLPTEILSLIFSSRVPDEYDEDRDDRYIVLGCLGQGRQGSWCSSRPFILASVCYRWREVAIDTPHIWTHIYFDGSLEYDEYERVDKGFLSERLKMILERSKGFPLSIYMGTRFETDSPLLHLLASQFHRWVEIRFMRLDWDSSAMLGSLNPNISFPALQKLAFCDDDDARVAFEPHISLFTNAPKLQVLALDMLPNPPPPASPDEDGTPPQVFPWNQIHRLQLHLCRDKEVFNAIELCPNLESVVFTDFIAATESEIDVDAPLEHQASNLHQVEFKATEGCGKQGEYTSYSDVLDALTLPEVHTMLFTRYRYPKGVYDCEWPRSSIDSFLQRSKCSLTTLHIDGHSLSDQDALAFLTLTPMLTRLRIQENRGNITIKTISPLFLRALHAFSFSFVRTSASPLVPKLTSLQFTADGTSLDDTLFADMVVSRWIPEVKHATAVGVECLQLVKLGIFGREFNEVQRRRLECLKIVGLKVEVFQIEMNRTCNFAR